MIDQTLPVFFLRRGVLLSAVKISGIAFSASLVAVLACLVAGWVAWGACWLAFTLLFLLAYGFILLLGGGLIIFGICGLAKSGYGFAGFIAGCLGIFVFYKGQPLAADFLKGQRQVLVAEMPPGTSCAEKSLMECHFAATYLWRDVFLKYRLHLYPWSVAAGAFFSAGISLATLQILRLERFVKGSLLRIQYRCKNCGHTRQRFRCTGAGCSEWHGDLQPTVYGFLWARCSKCRSQLPVTDFSGRFRLTAACASAQCGGASAAGTGAISEYHFPVVGAQSSGKTCFISVAIWKLMEYAGENGFKVTIPDPSQSREFEEMRRRLESGLVPEKTQSRARPFAVTVDVETASGQTSRLYLYDAAGEDFEAGDLATHTHGTGSFDFFEYADGVLFILDPLAEEAAGPAMAGDAPARFESSHLLDRFLPVVERARKASAGRKVDVPVAVVVTKADRAQCLGESSTLLDRLGQADSPRPFRSWSHQFDLATRSSAATRNFLLQIGAANVVNSLEVSFWDIWYFGVSALGRTRLDTDRSAFKPVRVLDPWIALAVHSGAMTDSGAWARAFRNLRAYLWRALRGQEGHGIQLGIWAAGAVVLLLGACAGFLRNWRW